MDQHETEKKGEINTPRREAMNPCPNPRFLSRRSDVHLCSFAIPIPYSFPAGHLLFVAVALEQELLELVDGAEHLVGTGQHPPADLLNRKPRNQIHGDALSICG